jgi:hypothetical protein
VDGSLQIASSCGAGFEPPLVESTANRKGVEISATVRLSGAKRFAPKKPEESCRLCGGIFIASLRLGVFALRLSFSIGRSWKIVFFGKDSWPLNYAEER